MNGRINSAVRDLQTLFEAGSLGGLSDGQLLDRFVAWREGAVFEAIVLRHGPMVWASAVEFSGITMMRKTPSRRASWCSPVRLFSHAT